MPVNTEPDKIPTPAGGDPPEAQPLQDAFQRVQELVTELRGLNGRAQAQADLALNRARDALEVSLVRAQVADAGVVIPGGSPMGSIALDVSAIVAPTGGRTVNSPTRVVATKDGFHRGRARPAWSGVSSGALGRRYALIRKNAAGSASGGTDESETADVAAADNAAVIQRLDTGLIRMNAGDYLELFVQHTQGSALRVLGGRGGTYLELEFVRPFPS